MKEQKKIKVDNGFVEGEIEEGKCYRISDDYYSTIEGKVLFMYDDLDLGDEDDICYDTPNFFFMFSDGEKVKVDNFLVENLDQLEVI